MRYLYLFADFLHEDHYNDAAYWYYDIQITVNSHNDEEIDALIQKYSDIIEEKGAKDNKRAVIIRCSNKIKADEFISKIKEFGAKFTKKKIYEKETDPDYNTQF